MLGGFVAIAVTKLGGPNSSANRRATTSTKSTPRGVTPPPAAVPGLKRTIEVTAVGDLMMGTSQYGLPSDGGASLFESVKPLLHGDVVIANLEGTLSTGGASKCGSSPGPNCYAFQMPPEYAKWIQQAGITAVTLANNHSGDFGDSARAQTRQALADADIVATGTPEGSIAYLKAAGGTVAFVGFGFNQGMNSILDLPRAKEIVQEAARHASIVVVMMHNGAEGRDAQHLTFASEIFFGENRGNPTAFARAMVDAGADLVVGHGPHVMRAMEVRKGRLIAYSLGNFMGYGAFSLSGPSGESGVLSVRLAPDGRLLGGRLTSLALYGKGVPAPGGTSIQRVRELTTSDLGQVGASIAADGAISGAPAS